MGDYEDQLAHITEKVNEDLTGPFPGGPYDPSILKSFHCHAAAKIWHNDERGILKCLNHGFKVGEWSFNLEDNEHFGLCGKMAARDNHLPFGEMSPTLDDVSLILGIPVIGKSVSCKKLSNVDAGNLLVEALGVTIDEANVALKVARGQSIKVEWLRQRFRSTSNVDNDNTIECAARAYLLYLLGCTLFADKIGTRVLVVYFSFLMDLRSVASYAWGAATLAFLYRQLGTDKLIDSALSISRSMLEIGYNEAAPTRDMLRNAMKKITQVLEGQQSTEEHTPSENLVYTRRRKHGATS
ncbi:protein MAIN-LIKE 1-like [Camellia sinensis]|uniref:protein MAIN-LIKE 1-like n=1 Tax=Camellia sinensis TaxID=4442 RepID=UPI001036A8D7|nr:protein MAIN-LIKE 1-like [Camellia sinensis]